MLKLYITALTTRQLLSIRKQLSKRLQKFYIITVAGTQLPSDLKKNGLYRGNLPISYAVIYVYTKANSLKSQ